MRAWIVGNGPSLKDTNLDLLRGEISFATNRIYKYFKPWSDGGDTLIGDEASASDIETIPHWRPNYYVRLESPDISHPASKADIASIKHPCVMFLHKGYSGLMPWKNVNPRTRGEWFETCRYGYPYVEDFEANMAHDWHLDHHNGLKHICNFGSSLHAAMQIAVVLGFGPLYLLGCDLGYKDGAVNHFIEGYSDGYKLRPAADVNRDLYGAHKVAARCCPVPIYNATVGGELDVYPRVKMEDVLCG